MDVGVGASGSTAATSATDVTSIGSTRESSSNQAQHSSGSRIQQPKPQALPSRTGPTSILVSPRQKGNPVLNNIRQMPWEYSDIPADYVLGATTCALFLSLTYHRLHPEYVYNRIRGLQHKYNLRILLTMVDVNNHEEPLKELSKTSLINNVTLILCWSAQEAGRYLELFKSYEHAAPTSIRAHQATSYSDKLVEFITVPRSINKTDAVSLVSTFGSVRTAVNASPEELSLVAGWGGKKVQRWSSTVREPFRVQKTAKRVIGSKTGGQNLSREDPKGVVEHDGYAADPPERTESFSATPGPVLQSNPSIHPRGSENIPEEIATEEDQSRTLASEQSNASNELAKPANDGLSEGVAAALAKLRRDG